MFGAFLASFFFVAAAQATLEPVTALVLTRHGARSPYISIPGLKLDQWDCSFSLFQYPGVAPQTNTLAVNGPLYRKTYVPDEQALPGNCSQGQLTQTGANQLHDTGKWLRSALGDFLPAQWDSNTMYARSTDIDRTFESAENLLQGLFPGSGPDNGVADVVNIWTVEKGYDFVDVGQNKPCPKLKALCTAISQSPEWEAHLQAIAPLQQKLATAFGLPLSDMPDIAGTMNTLRARAAQGLPLIVDQQTYEEVEAAATWELQALYNNATVHKFTSGQLVEDVVSTLSSAVNGSGRVFTLISAHDTTVAPFLSALHVNWTMWPNFASNVLLTVLKDGDNNVFVQMNHDRKPVQMGDCALQCPWDDFVSIASQSYIKDRDTQCQMRKRYVVDPFVGYLC